jgi:hypothetical protein
MWRESGSGNLMMNDPLPLHPEKPLPSPREPKKNSSLSVYKIRRISLSSYD